MHISDTKLPIKYKYIAIKPIHFINFDYNIDNLNDNDIQNVFILYINITYCINIYHIQIEQQILLIYTKLIENKI